MYKIIPKNNFKDEKFASAFCCNPTGDILAVSSILNDRQGKVTIYKCNDEEATERITFFCPELSNVACAMTSTDKSFYFTAITEEHKGVVYEYNIECNHFKVLFTTDITVGNHFGFNDSSISISEDASTIVITDVDLIPHPNEKKLSYSCRVLIYRLIDNEYKLIRSLCPFYETDVLNRRMFGRSLALTKDGKTLFVGCPDLSFDYDNDKRIYNGMHSKVYIYSEDNNWEEVRSILPIPRSSGNFYGTEIELSEDEKTLVIMASGQDDKVGAAFILVKIDSDWVYAQKVQPRAIRVQTKNKLSFYGVAINKDVIYFGDSLPGKIYKYEKDRHSYRQVKTISSPIDKKDLFAYDLCISKDGKRLFCSSALESNGSCNGSIYVFSDK